MELTTFSKVVQVCRPISVTLTKIFLKIIVSLIQLGCPGLLVHHFNAQQNKFMKNIEFLVGHYYLFKIMSASQTMHCAVLTWILLHSCGLWSY